MKSLRIVGLICLTLMFATALAGQKDSSNPASRSNSKTISASGYVTAGVEAGCLMLQDAKTKTLYNLFFAGKKRPALGDAIQFTGTRHDGPTTCMQGEAVDVKKWTPLKTTPGTEKNHK